MRRLLALSLAVLAAHVAAAREPGEPQHYPSTTLLSAETNIVNEPIRYPTTGPAQVTAAVITLAPGEKTSVHKHGVPLFAYVLEGELTVDYAGYKQRTFRAGEAFMEAMDVAHIGINTGTGPMRVLAVYMGAKGSQNVIPVK